MKLTNLIMGKSYPQQSGAQQTHLFMPNMESKKKTKLKNEHCIYIHAHKND